MYSLFQLPKNTSEREKVYKKILNKKKLLYFAVENLRLKYNYEKNHIENIIKIKTLLPSCIKKLNEN